MLCVMTSFKFFKILSLEQIRTVEILPSCHTLTNILWFVHWGGGLTVKRGWHYGTSVVLTILISTIIELTTSQGFLRSFEVFYFGIILGSPFVTICVTIWHTTNVYHKHSSLDLILQKLFIFTSVNQYTFGTID